MNSFFFHTSFKLSKHAIKMHRSWMLILMNFDNCVHLCNHRPVQDVKHFTRPCPRTLLSASFLSVPLPTLGTHSDVCLCGLPAVKSVQSECLICCVWLLSLRMFRGFISVIASISNSKHCLPLSAWSAGKYCVGKTLESIGGLSLSGFSEADLHPSPRAREEVSLACRGKSKRPELTAFP